MMPSNNPTAASAVVGEEIEFGSGGTAVLLKNLVMPAVLIAFATYLLVGILTMRVPEGTSFPGPQFFPGLIMAGLYLFAVLLIISALREHRAAAEAHRIYTEEIELILEEDAAAGLGAAGAGGADGAGSGSRTGKAVGLDWKSLAWIVGSFLVFSLTLQFLGWVIGAALLFVCVARGFGSTRPFFGLIVGLTISSISYIAFDMMLGLSLPSGILGWGF